METITLNPKSEVTAIKVSLRCPDCGHTWAVFLDGNRQLPPKGDRCLECAKKKSDQVRQAFEKLI